MDEDVWKLVENAAKKDKRSMNNWLETHLAGYFLKESLKEKK